jgi:hypothetical protein
MSPALSQQQSSSSYTSPQTAMFSTSSRTPNQQSYNTQQQQQPQQQAPQSRSPLEALQIQQRHFQEQLALLQHQQRQLQATAEAVAAASNSPYVNGTNPSSGSSRPATTPGVGGSQSTNPSPSYFSPLTSPALEATSRSGGFRHQHQHQHQQHSHFSPNFDPRAKRQPHPLSALSSPALNPIGSSGGAQQTLSPALNPQNNTDMSDPDYYRALVGMLDGSQQVPQQQQMQQRQMVQYQASGSTSSYTSPAALQYIDTSALSSPMVGPQSATSNGNGHGQSHGPGPNRQALPSRTRPSPMIKPSPHMGRGHHSRHGSTSVNHSPNVQFTQKYNGASVPQPNYLPPAAIDQRGVQAHHQQIARSATSETPSPVDLSTMMPPPPVPTGQNTKTVTPMTPASLMNLGGGRAPDVGTQENGQAITKRPVGSRAAQTSRPLRKTVNGTAGTSAASGSGTNGAGKKVKIAPAGKRALAARPPGVGVRAGTFLFSYNK